jgi:pimeloyl-ACP methyl ester carboxylesterase
MSALLAQLCLFHLPSLTLTDITDNMFHSSATLLVLSAALAAPGAATTASQVDVVLPTQLGPYPVSIYQHEVKTTRPDPLASTPQLRRLMATVYRPFLDTFTCPLEHQSHIDYISPIVATALLESLPLNTTALGDSFANSSSLLANVKLANCSRPISSSSIDAPILLFSPGYGGPVSGYASILSTVASSGYTIVAIDPTFEAAAVVFPDGHVAYPSNTTNAYDNTTSGQNFLQAVRIADAVSVLDSIEAGKLPGLERHAGAGNKSNPLRTAMFGHSFGGSTAVNVALVDDRVIAAANIDGPIYPPVNSATMRKPVFMVQSSTLSPTESDWPNFYKINLHGWKSWVRPNNTKHYSFTDLPQLADLLGLRGAVFPEKLIGTVNSQRLQDIMWRYTAQFLDHVFGRTPAGLLEASSAEFPDVKFVAHEK